jgi:hypothetical protein
MERGIAAKIAFKRFALVQEELEFTGQTPTLKAVQYG